MTDGGFLPRSEIKAAQLSKLRQLLQTVVPANGFYGAKFQAAGIRPDVHSFAEFSDLPFTTKNELVRDQLHHPPFGTNLTFPLAQYTRYHQTSGTSGAPLRWLDTPQSWDWMLERWLEIFRAAAVGPADRIVFAFSFGPFIGFWLAFEAGERLGALCIPAGGLSSLGRVRMILETEATVLCCTPTYAIHMAEAAQVEKIDLSRNRLRRIIVAGEPGGSIPATRARLETLWPGARVFDHHGMTETGPVTYECPARPGFLHVMESGFIAEVIDPATGRAIEAGSPGELVLTPLGRSGSPLIRYRTGDLVQIERRPDPNTACPCGRHDMVLEGGIIGRVDDMVIVRGVNVYPTAVEHVLRGCGEIAEYQVRILHSGSLTELTITIEPEATCRDVPALIARASKAFQSTFALRIPVEAVQPGTLPRFEMKAKRWVRED